MIVFKALGKKKNVRIILAIPDKVQQEMSKKDVPEMVTTGSCSFLG